MNPEEKNLFLDAVGDVKPLKDHTNIRWDPQPKAPIPKPQRPELSDNFLTLDYLDVIPLSASLDFHLDGVQPGVLEKLRQGKYDHQDSLYLLRMPVEQCRQQLFTFIRQAAGRGLRNVLIVHGRGRTDRAHANIVRSYLGRWLVEFPEVQAFCQAAPQKGGAGACYVMLKKSEQIKQDNWERHARRGK